MSDQQVIVFTVAGEQYGVPVEQVQSIERMLPITRVPKTLPFIKGVVNLRGVVLPVLDMRERFGFAPAETTEDARVVVVRSDRYTVGLVVDAVDDVTVVPKSAIEPPPAMVGGVEAVYLHGVARLAERLLILLNLDRVLSDAEERQLQEVEKSVQG
ncbi:MAG: chemotaxis protein CheW [Alicyclobacillus sp.]|nr:chemotaxis protein CheW [Alicyclobacillus sp.]